MIVELNFIAYDGKKYLEKIGILIYFFSNEKTLLSNINTIILSVLSLYSSMRINCQYKVRTLTSCCYSICCCC
jgi:hypothetical protein